MSRSRRRRSRSAIGRATDQAVRVGLDVKLARGGLGMTRRAVGRLAGVAPASVQRIELGGPGVQVDTLCAVGEAVGLDIVVRAYPGRPPSLRDSGQLDLAEQLRADAHAAMRCELETRAGDHGEAADQVFYGPDELVHVEIERMAVDFQAQYRSAVRKRDWLAARHARPVRLVIAIEDTHRNRVALREHERLIRSALPAGSRQIRRALRTGAPLGTNGLLWLRRRRAPAKRGCG